MAAKEIVDHDGWLIAQRIQMTLSEMLSRLNIAGIDDVPVDAKLLRREPKRQPYELRQMQHRHVELLAHVLLDLALEAVKHGMAEGTRCHHRLRAGAFCRLDVLTGELDGNPLVMGGGMESAALGTSAVVDRLAAQQLREPL